MKPILILTLTVFVLLLTAPSVKAQNKDYVVITNGDTITCKVKHSLLGSSIKNRTADTGTWKTIQIDSVRAYYMSAKTILYRKVSMPNEALDRYTFMQIVGDGKICLYELDVVRYNGRNTYTSYFTICD